MSALFEGPGPRLFSVPASAPFLEVLADAMVDALARTDDPFALSDALVLLPNRRAARGLIEAFAQRLGGAALLPTIRPLGDLDDAGLKRLNDQLVTLDLQLSDNLVSLQQQEELTQQTQSQQALGAQQPPLADVAIGAEARRLPEHPREVEHRKPRDMGEQFERHGGKRERGQASAARQDWPR